MRKNTQGLLTLILSVIETEVAEGSCYAKVFVKDKHPFNLEVIKKKLSLYTVTFCPTHQFLLIEW